MCSKRLLRVLGVSLAWESSALSPIKLYSLTIYLWCLYFSVGQAKQLCAQEELCSVPCKARTLTPGQLSGISISCHSYWQSTTNTLSLPIPFTPYSMITYIFLSKYLFLYSSFPCFLKCPRYPNMHEFFSSSLPSDSFCVMHKSLVLFTCSKRQDFIPSFC